MLGLIFDKVKAYEKWCKFLDHPVYSYIGRIKVKGQQSRLSQCDSYMWEIELRAV